MLVDVYLNLNEFKRTGKVTYSIRARSGPKKGLVIGHEQQVFLKDVKMTVQPAARARIAAGAAKEVHAWVSGTLEEVGPKSGWVRFRYNPKLFKTFVLTDSQQPIHHANWALLDESGAYAILDRENQHLTKTRNPGRVRKPSVPAHLEVLTWNG